MTQSYNAWLPLPVANELDIEAERFQRLVKSIVEIPETSTLASRLASVQWISVVNT
jgi:hypothetical protein